jgi:hypothetical protein
LAVSPCAAAPLLSCPDDHRSMPVRLGPTALRRAKEAAAKHIRRAYPQRPDIGRF